MNRLPEPRPRNNDLCVDCGGWVSSHTAQALPAPDGSHHTRHDPDLDCTVNPVPDHTALLARSSASAPALDRPWSVTSVIESTRSGSRILLERVTTRTTTGTRNHWEVTALGGPSATFTNRLWAWKAFTRWPRT